ncbi:hypothetical protein [Ideonella sp. YS5]|uniref:hypothetical protein n=1 Tax=Ideonella sp. YS5 TaxID=3453714 RepID=UPI003EEAC075
MSGSLFDDGSDGELQAIERDVLVALALGAAPRPRAWVVEFLAQPGVREGGARRATIDEVRAAIAQLDARGCIEQHERKPGFWGVANGYLPGVMESVLARVPLPALREALGRADGYRAVTFAAGRLTGDRVPTIEAAFALVRLEILGGTSVAAVEALDARLPWGVQAQALSDTALDGC